MTPACPKCQNVPLTQQELHYVDYNRNKSLLRRLPTMSAKARRQSAVRLARSLPSLLELPLAAREPAAVRRQPEREESPPSPPDTADASEADDSTPSDCNHTQFRAALDRDVKHCVGWLETQCLNCEALLEQQREQITRVLQESREDRAATPRRIQVQ